MNEQLTQLYGYSHGMWRYRWSSLFIAWIAVIIGWLVVLSLPDTFNVKAVVYVDTSSVMKPLLKGLAPDMGPNDELAVMSRILLGRENLLTIIRETDMDLGVRTTEEKEELLKKLKNNITIKGGSGRGSNNVYELDYDNKNANLAYKVVSNLLSTMIEDTLKSTRTDTATAQKFLDTQINEYERRLSEAELQLANFKKANVGFMPDEKGNYYARLQGAQDTVNSTGSKLKLAQRRYTELKKQLSGEKPIIDSQNYASGTSSKLNQYNNQLNILLNSYTDKHPDVLALNAAIEKLKASGSDVEGKSAISENSDTMEFNPVYQEMKVEVNKASVEVETLKIQLSEQIKQVAMLKESIDIIPEVEAKLTRLNRDYDITRERYLDLVERRESAKLAQSADESSRDISFRVIDPPIIPSLPSGPPRLLLLSAALVLSLGVGLAWGFIRFILEPTFFDLNQVSSKTGLPILGTVSLYLSPEHIARRKWQMTTFVSVAFLMLLAYGSVMFFNKQGSALVASVVSDLNRDHQG